MGNPVILVENVAVVHSRSINSEFDTCLRETDLIKSVGQRLLPAWAFCTVLGPDYMSRDALVCREPG